ncbi:P-loop NTPase fold protein [Chromobacterium sp. Panama]|uniref:P-loop NTPase fold protein n=1 Tax=Chromobacterium sp. Panama TaxID=2161826 RepID=UPI0011B21081|nr:P-loop NTPase fold protein [Chromobacterium sp. Panama]
MSMYETKEQLVELLKGGENRVISLVGRWGTGKSHLWNEIKKESAEHRVKSSVYVSLFGVRNIEQLIQKAAKSIFLDADKREFRKLVNNLPATIKGFGKIFGKDLSAIDDVIKVFELKALDNRLIVIDDIERKHKDLCIDEIFGFIDEYRNQHGARFVLILNHDKIEGEDCANLWHSLKEKVIEHEFHLDTTAQEAFEIAIKSMPTHENIQHDVLLRNIECGNISNIRIVHKIIKVLNAIFDPKIVGSLCIPDYMISAAVFLTAIHYRAIGNDLNLEFVMSKWSGQDVLGLSKKEPAEKAERELVDLLRKFSLLQCGDFELELNNYLKFGRINEGALTKIFTELSKDIDRNHYYNLVCSSLENSYEHMNWNHRASDADLVGMAQPVADLAEYLNVGTINSFYEAISPLDGGKELAEQGVDNWVKSFNSKEFNQENNNYTFTTDLHQKIKSAIENKKKSSYSKVSFVEACNDMFRREAWGAKHITAVNNVSKEYFILALNEWEMKDRKELIVCATILLKNKAMYESQFGKAMNDFVEACRQVVSNDRDSRHAQQLISLFDSDELGNIDD